MSFDGLLKGLSSPMGSLGLGLLANSRDQYGNFAPFGDALAGGMNTVYKQQLANQLIQEKQATAQQQAAQQQWMQQNMPGMVNAPTAMQAEAFKAMVPGQAPDWQQKYDWALNNPDKAKRLSDMGIIGGKGTSVHVAPTTILGKGDGKYIEERMKGDAIAMSEVQKAAQSAYNQNKALQRFADASAKGYAGGAGALMAGTTNLLSSFGYAPDGLKDYRMMEQAIGEILSNKMAELGARGLTDKDMQILRENLPRVETDKRSRVAIANVLTKANNSTIQGYIDRVGMDRQNFPDARFYVPKWVDGWSPAEIAIPDQQNQGGYSIRRVK